MEFIIAFLTLTFLEIILGVDNIIFVSIVTNKLPKHQQRKGRIIGLTLALVFRLILLVLITWLIHHLTTPFFPLENLTTNVLDYFTTEEVLEKMHHKENILEKAKLLFHTIGVRELILSIGGLFLLGKSVSEVHHKMEGAAKEHKNTAGASMAKIIMQIILLDLVFSFDSILTAVGITDNIYTMVIAVVVAMVVMLVFSGKISSFIAKHPTLEMLALSFLILIGFMLLLEGVHIEVPKGYIYFAVFFSLIVEVLNLSIKKKKEKKNKPVELIRKIKDDE